MAKSSTPALKGTGLRNAGIILFIVGTLAALASTYGAGMAVNSAVDGFQHLPRERAIALTAGRGVLEAHPGEIIVIAKVRATGGPATCQVTDPSGEVLPMDEPTRARLHQPTVELVGAVLAPMEGDYKISCVTDDDLAAVPVQAGTVLSTGASVGLILAGVLFGFVSLAGLVLFIVGLNQRRRARRMPQPQPRAQYGYGAGPQYSPYHASAGYGAGPQGYGPAPQGQSGFGPTPQGPQPYGPMPQGPQHYGPASSGAGEGWQEGSSPSPYGQSGPAAPGPYRPDPAGDQGFGRPEGS